MESFPPSLQYRSRWMFALDLPTQINNQTDATNAVVRWKEALYKIFRPIFGQSQPLFLVNWLVSRRQFQTIDLTLCANPTAHEFLEAQLELREFLRPHLATEEIEKLLHP